MRCGRLGLGHPPRDGLLQLGEVEALGAPACRLELLPCAGRGSGWGRRCRCRRRGCDPCLLFPVSSSFHIGLDDPPPGSGTRERGELEPPIACHPAGKRRGLDPRIGRSFGGCCRLSCFLLPACHRAVTRLLFPVSCLLVTLFSGRDVGLPTSLGSRANLPCIPNPRDHPSNGQRRSLVGNDLDQRPGRVGLIDHVGLVGLDLDQLVPDDDLIPDGLHPAENGPLLHRVGQPRHHDVSRHRYLAPTVVSSTALTM